MTPEEIDSELNKLTEKERHNLFFLVGIASGIQSCEPGLSNLQALEKAAQLFPKKHDSSFHGIAVAVLDDCNKCNGR